MKLNIVQAGDPVLRKKGRELTKEEIRSPRIQTLIELMRETMREAPGVGLAAPQIGESIQLAVIEDRADYIDDIPAEKLAELQRAAVPFHVIINPKLSFVGDSSAQFFEGCLSVEGYQAVVDRALNVRVECLNERGEEITINAHGWYARILQHEIDHLNGTLYIDRMKTRTLTTTENAFRYWLDHSVEEVLAEVERQPTTPAKQ
ncbi:MAG TPA: peptide deformylase [Pyrinomonadaceae bacterium]|nr:peptide deformylase [Pyrinomonadaceae bacterium]